MEILIYQLLCQLFNNNNIASVLDCDSAYPRCIAELFDAWDVDPLLGLAIVPLANLRHLDIHLRAGMGQEIVCTSDRTCDKASIDGGEYVQEHATDWETNSIGHMMTIG
jgi:hypothetical protein